MQTTRTRTRTILLLATATLILTLPATAHTLQPETTTHETHPEQETTPATAWLAPLLILLALTTIALTLPIKKPGLLKRLPNHRTEWLYRHWRDKGLAHERHERYEKAIKPYEKTTQLRPANPFPWYLLARTHLHAGNPETTIQTIHDAEKHADFIPRDIHEVHILALWDADKKDEIPTTLDDIAQRDADTAISLAHDFEFHDMLADHDAAWWVNAQPARGQGIDGYA